MPKLDFLETIESIEAARASIQTIYSGEGTRVRSLVRDTPDYMRRLAEAGKLWADVLKGRRPEWVLREALTTSDFPLYTADIIDRTMLAKYREWVPTWPAYAARRTVRDFRTVKEFPPAYGADLRLTEVPEQTEYPEATLAEQAAITWSVKKYGRRIAFSWEAITNDDLEQLMGIPERFALAARRTESRFVVELFVDASGPHASLYTVGNANKVTGNPVLSITALQTAMTILAAQTDEEGEPILIDAVTLVVPPALEIVARNILNAIELRITAAAAGGEPGNGTTTGHQELVVQNWMRNKLTLVVDPYITQTATTANGNTSWFLFANPNQGRPALRIGFLRGHEEPEIFIKESNARRVGGGQSDPMDGDFETDTVQWKVRHVLGGSRIDPKMTVASNGSGS